MEIILIAAVGMDGIIGVEGKLPWKIPADLRRFKELTKGHPCIMGRKTYESLPKSPLPDRLNIVLTHDLFRNGVVDTDEVKYYDKLVSALWYCKKNGYKKVFICGGESVYEEAIHLSNTMYLTYVFLKANVENLDRSSYALFPSFGILDWYPHKRERMPDHEFFYLTRKTPVKNDFVEILDGFGYDPNIEIVIPDKTTKQE